MEAIAFFLCLAEDETILRIKIRLIFKDHVAAYGMMCFPWDILYEKYIRGHTDQKEILMYIFCFTCYSVQLLI